MRWASGYALVEVSKGDALVRHASKRAYGTDTWCYAFKLSDQVCQWGCMHILKELPCLFENKNKKEKVEVNWHPV